MSKRCDFDAVVIGAGPAGTLAARGIARSGRSVLIVDRSSFPRHKVCGCCLNRDALATLASAGLEKLVPSLGGVALREVVLSCANRCVRLALPGGCSLSRYALDAALVEAAEAAGVEFWPGTAAKVIVAETDGHLPQVKIGRDRVITTRSIVVADGLGGTSLRDVAGFTPRVVPASRYGLGGVAAASTSSDAIRPGVISMAIGRQGYLGAVRLEDGSIDFAAAVNPLALKSSPSLGGVARQIASEAGMADRFPLGAVEHWQLTPTLTRRRGRVASPHIFVAGDAVGYVEPFTGEGMAWALASGHAVASFVGLAIEGHPAEAAAGWTAAHKRMINRRQWSCKLTAGLLRRPRLTRAAIHVLGLTPQLARPAVHHLSLRSTGWAAGPCLAGEGHRR